MTPIGIMSAMHEGLAAVLQVLPDEQRVQVAGRDFWQGHLHGRLWSRCWPAALCRLRRALCSIANHFRPGGDNAHADFNRFIRAVASRYSVAMLSQWLKNP
jgi:nucleoside phosphorylase